MTLMPARTCLLLAASSILAAHAADLKSPVLVPRPLPAPASKTILARKASPTPPPPSTTAVKTSPIVTDQAVILEIRRAPAASRPKDVSASAARLQPPPTLTPLPRDGEVRIQRSGRQLALPGAP